MIDLNEQVVIVTGGAGLLGKSFVKSIASNNGIAILADIDEKAGREIANELRVETRSEDIRFRQLDILKKSSINSLFTSIKNEFNRVDALVNCANPRNDRFWDHFFDVEVDDFNENISLSLGGYFLCSQQAAKFFKKQGYGNIINIASIYGSIAPRFEVYEGTQMTMPISYAAIKSALIHLTKYMAKYFKGMNIRVNAISPGGILNQESDLFLNNYKKFCSNKGMLDKEDLQGTLLFLLSDLSTYINGQNIIVDDGFVL